MDTTNNRFFLCDMHSHILPGMDDGAENVKMSLELLKQASKQHIAAIVCTPHYYSGESVEAFLERRERARIQLENALSKVRFVGPELWFGAEVAYYTGLIQQAHLEKLCINGTNYILLEMPFAKWTPMVFRDIQELRNVYGIVPIIAHLERYLNIQDKKTINALLEMDVLIQMNGSYLLSWRTAGKAKKMLKKGYVQILGSDCHSPSQRPQTLGLAAEQMVKWGMEEKLREICLRSARILRG